MIFIHTWLFLSYVSVIFFSAQFMDFDDQGVPLMADPSCCSKDVNFFDDEGDVMGRQVFDEKTDPGHQFEGAEHIGNFLLEQMCFRKQKYHKCRKPKYHLQ